MIVGTAFSGKSSILETLRHGISRLKGTENYLPVVTIKLNPKSVSSD
jgi:ABC-type phosphate/phosphonate transport system ATPase subunit